MTNSGIERRISTSEPANNLPVKLARTLGSCFDRLMCFHNKNDHTHHVVKINPRLPSNIGSCRSSHSTVPMSKSHAPEKSINATPHPSLFLSINMVVIRDAIIIARMTVSTVPMTPAMTICKRRERPLVVNFGGFTMGMMNTICDVTKIAAEITE